MTGLGAVRAGLHPAWWTCPVLALRAGLSGDAERVVYRALAWVDTDAAYGAAPARARDRDEGTIKPPVGAR